MIIPAIFVVTGLLALGLILYLARGNRRSPASLETLTSELRTIDVDAFRNLIDECEDEFLRQGLTPSDYRRIHRQRMRAAVDYVACAGRNAGVLIRLAEAARQAGDPAIADTANKLLENALRLRLYTIQTLPRLYLSMVFPRARLAPYMIADTYDTITQQVITLRRLQNPATGISTVQ
jgi:hypothetical protein